MGLNVLIFNTQRQESKELLTILNSAYTCQICTTVAKGLSLLKKKNNDIDIVICDLTTNLKEGGVFITAIRSDFALATIPILVVASNTGHEYQEGIRLGANGFLLKPYNREVVLNIVKGGIDFKLHPQLIGTL
ncbi:MAG: response regulator [Bacilli bacterium]|jgi:DNA-binding NarL/FixJ family response regulator|nr:response regulator [Bacilli bacterium]